MQGPTSTDLPGSLSERLVSHKNLAPLPSTVNIAKLTSVLDGTTLINVPGLVAENILACQEGLHSCSHKCSKFCHLTCKLFSILT